MRLHIYGQQFPGDDVVLVGDREALETLVTVIRAALDGTPPQWPDYFAGDGEDYAVTVKLLPHDDRRWQRLVLPYDGDDASEDALGVLELLVGA